MDMGLFRGLVTLVLFVAFCGVVIWAYSGLRKDAFDKASRLPLDSNGESEKNDG